MLIAEELPGELADRKVYAECVKRLLGLHETRATSSNARCPHSLKMTRREFLLKIIPCTLFRNVRFVGKPAISTNNLVTW